MRIGTWNVQYGRGAAKNLARREVLQQQQADIWVLTETHDDLAPGEDFRPVHSTRRYSAANGGRWVTVWTRLTVLARHATADPSRTVAVTLDGGTAGPVTVFGTVLPWQHDGGPNGSAPGWSEFYRVTPDQGREWRALRDGVPDATLVVAGDLNHSLGGPHYYGTTRGRQLLRDELAAAGARCLTEFEQFPAGQLCWPPIDHICVAPPSGRSLQPQVTGWPGTADGTVLSDHSGVLADVSIASGGAGPG